MGAKLERRGINPGTGLVDTLVHLSAALSGNLRLRVSEKIWNWGP